jgi:hypothetical protein
MPVPRPFLLRLTLAIAAMLLLCLAAYLGLGWAVWDQAPWLSAHLSSSQRYRLERAYARALCGLLSGDRDSDGIRDGAEIFWRTDPVAPAQRLHLLVEDFLVWDIRDPSYLHLGDIEYSPPASSASGADLPKACEAFQVHPGERCRVRAESWTLSGINSPLPRFATADRWPIRFFPGEDSTGMVRFPGSTIQRTNRPSSASLPGSFVAETSGGWVEFEFEVPAGAETSLQKVHNIVAARGARNDSFSAISFRCVWRWSPQPLVVEKQEHASPRDWNGETVFDRYQLFQLSWPPVDSHAEAILLEIARDEPDATFLAVREYPSTATRCFLVRRVDMDDDDYRGELKFRIVPISSARPEN